jgi:signal transduction histidine kinase
MPIVMRRGKPEVLVATLIALLLGSYVWYTQRVVIGLKREAQRSSVMLARVYRALGDTTEGSGTQTLVELLQGIREQGIPIVVVDPQGRPSAHANLPFDPANALPEDDPRIREYTAVLGAENPPVDNPLIGKVYYGNTALVRGLRIIPILQTVTAVILLLAGFYIFTTRSNAARERLWAGMARESAHQLGTPLSSLAGWIELLEERAEDPGVHAAVTHMRADLERLDRVSHRFERIGREAKLEEIDIGAVVDHVARYFRARVPTLANTIDVDWHVARDLPPVRGDPVLIEWAVEVLTKNAIDALAGRGGHVQLAVERTPERGICIRVADDGPGIPRDIRSRVFDPGFSTKKSGWGIGLSLAKRIVEENHGGKLVLAPSEQGAVFEIMLG